MHPNWLASVFPISNTPKNPRPLSGSDARNLKIPGNPNFRDLWRAPGYGRDAISGLNTIFSMQGSNTESTSTSIVKAGFNKVWGRPRLTEPKASILTSHRHPAGPGFRVPSVPLQRVANEKQPEQGITHATPNLEAITACSQPAVAPMSTGLPSHKAGQLDSELFTPTSTVPQLSSGSVYLSSSLQRTANEEQPEQDIFHLQKPVQTSGPIPQPAVTPISNHLPSPQTSQPEREPFTSYIPTHPSGSRFLSFSLQKAANKQPDLEQGIPQPPNLVASRTFGSIPQSATAPRLPSVQATRFLRSPFQEVPPSQQPEYGQNIGLNLFAAGQDSFYLPPISSPHVNQRFPSNPPLPSAFPLAQSLLFLPPNPPPKTKFNFSPFSPEEDTVPLPPAPRVKSNQHGITLPVRDLPPLSATRDYTVPYPPMFPPQSFDDLSPLPIALLLSPWAAAPDELNIKISGPQGYLNADNYQAHITRFLLSRINEVANSLVVVWQLSHVDSGGARGMMSLKALFVQLDEKVPNSDRTALSGFSKLSITIPDLVKDVTPCNNPIEEVDLTNAVELLEFIWHGDFAIFAFKFKNLSFATLTVLNLKSSHLSIEDAVTLLHSCPDLQTASLGIIQNEEDCDAVLPFKPSAVQRKILPRLAGLALESNVALHPLVVRIGWTGQINLSLTLRKQGTGNIHKLPLRWGAVSNIELNCHLTAQELFNVKRAFPSVIYHDMNI